MQVGPALLVLAFLAAAADKKAGCRVPPADTSWESWVNRKLLPPDEAKGMMRAFVETQIQPLPLPKTRGEWLARRDALRQEILTIVGIGDRKTGNDPYHPTGANGHDIRTFSFSRRSATAIEALDAIRALDVLTARPEVDPQRIGFTGESGGSNTTYWVSALDPRVKLAVPVCSVTTYDFWIRTDVNRDWHQRPPGIRRIADIGTLLALHAPNPLVVISSKRGTDDQEFPLDEAEKSYQWAKAVYRLYGADAAAAHHESTTAHGYQEDKRRILYRAVERWLRPPRPHGDKELAAKVETVEDLHCVLPERNYTFRSVFADWVKPLPRTSANDDPAALRAFLRERLSWPGLFPDVKARRIGGEEKGPWTAEFWILEPEAGIRLPAIRIGKTGPAGPITLVPGRDRKGIARDLQAGRSVLALDLRGTGEIAAPRETCETGRGLPAALCPAFGRSTSSRPHVSAGRNFWRRPSRWMPRMRTAGRRSLPAPPPRTCSRRAPCTFPGRACGTKFARETMRPWPTCLGCWNGSILPNSARFGRPAGLISSRASEAHSTTPSKEPA